MTAGPDDEIAALERRLEELRATPKPQSTAAAPTPLAPDPGSAKLALAIGVIGCIAFFAFMVTKCTPAETRSTPPATEEAVAETPPPPNSWDYSTETDPITDKVTKTACVTSNNEVQLTWPYSNVRARLCLRNSPRHGRDVFVHLLGDGQMLYRSYDTGTVTVRFGDAAAQKFSAVGSSDGSSNVVFITNRARFEAGAAKAPVTKIEAEFYQAGNQVMEFNTADLRW